MLRKWGTRKIPLLLALDELGEVGGGEEADARGSGGGGRWQERVSIGDKIIMGKRRVGRHQR